MGAVPPLVDEHTCSCLDAFQAVGDFGVMRHELVGRGLGEGFSLIFGQLGERGFGREYDELVGRDVFGDLGEAPGLEHDGQVLHVGLGVGLPAALVLAIENRALCIVHCSH